MHTSRVKNVGKFKIQTKFLIFFLSVCTFSGRKGAGVGPQCWRVVRMVIGKNFITTDPNVIVHFHLLADESLLQEEAFHIYENSCTHVQCNRNQPGTHAFTELLCNSIASNKDITE